MAPLPSSPLARTRWRYRATPAGAWRGEADRMLADLSWDTTFARMAALVDSVVRHHDETQPIVSPTTWPAAGAIEI